MKPIQIAVVGLGRAGWSIHLDRIKKDSRFQVVSVADPDRARTLEAETVLGCKSHASLDELLRAGEAEVVVIATPSFAHVADASAVIDAGLHCIVEKPIATSYADARRLAAHAEKAGRLLFVHHQQPFRPEARHLREAIDSGLLGDVFHIDAYWARYNRRSDWQTLRKNGGGQLNNHGSHALSVVLPLLDSPVRKVAADLQNAKDAGDAEDHCQLLLKAENGRSASVTVTSSCALPVTRWRLLGTRGTLSCDGATSTLRYCEAAHMPALTAVDGASKTRAYDKESLPWIETILPVEDKADAGDFYDNVHQVLREGGAMKVTPHDVLEITRVIDEAHRYANS
jgi:scyllo-inositol 2-dehydrogenase (NADP+)